MPSQNANGGISAAEIEAKLPKSLLVRRGHVRAAFGFSEEEMATLVPAVFKPVYLPPNKRRGHVRSRAFFHRSQVIAAAREMEVSK